MSTLVPLRRGLCGLVLVLAAALHGQSNGNGPCALVIGYRSSPQDRPAFRAYLEHQGIGQFEKWRQDGVLTSEDLLFTAFANQGEDDATVVLHFGHFSDLAKWSRIEHQAAGGISVAGAPSAGAVRTDLADLYRFKAAPGRDRAQGITMIIPYTVPGSMDQYKKYADGYVLPQLDGWIRRGVLNAYALYINQNGAGAKWDVLLFQEYNGFAGLAKREITKDEVRRELASNPVWKSWSDNKLNIRVEGHATIAEPILPP